MVEVSFTNAPLIGAGDWVGVANYVKLFGDKLFRAAIWNTAYFVLLTVVPGTLIALLIALMVQRLSGWFQSAILAAFFLPFILPVSVVYLIWQWTLDLQFGIGQYLIEALVGKRVATFRELPWFLPTVGWITIWWTNGFNILLFLAGLRAISPELYEAADIDGANRWHKFRFITWPLIWPITGLVLTIQLILQLKIFDQVYLFSIDGRVDATMTMVQYIYKSAFVQNKGGYAAAAAVALFAVVIIFSMLQFQALKSRREN
jgi:multiple sugar transport system permease protein